MMASHARSTFDCALAAIKLGSAVGRVHSTGKSLGAWARAGASAATCVTHTIAPKIAMAAGIRANKTPDHKSWPHTAQDVSSSHHRTAQRVRRPNVHKRGPNRRKRRQHSRPRGRRHACGFQLERINPFVAGWVQLACFESAHARAARGFMRGPRAGSCEVGEGRGDHHSLEVRVLDEGPELRDVAARERRGGGALLGAVPRGKRDERCLRVELQLTC